MSPYSPSVTRQQQPLVQAQTTLAPSPTQATGTNSRVPASNTLHRAAPQISADPTTSRRPDRDPVAGPSSHGHSRRGGSSKPIFDWITRKLTPGRRGTATHEGMMQSSSRLQQPVPRQTKVAADAKLPQLLRPVIQTNSANPHQLSPTQIFTSASPTRDNASIITRAESHSLRSYSLSYVTPSERERRREANNPYPSIPVPTHRTSTVESVSVSFLSRSRTPSLRSDASFRRHSMIDDASSYRPGRWADDDASIRPLPPSHTGSPTLSTHMISRSASASLLSPTHASAHRSNTPSINDRSRVRHSAPSPADLNYSFTSSELDGDENNSGKQSRRDSASTKPTTVLSFDSGPHIAHIATVPSTLGTHSAPSSPLRETASPIDTTVSSNPAQPTTTSGMIQLNFPSPDPVPSVSMSTTVTTVQAPKHSSPHPRDNPHPSLAPDPNSSTLTLASSTFGRVLPSLTNLNTGSASTHRLPPPSAMGRPTSFSTSPSVTFAPDSDRPTSVYEYPPSAHALPSLRAGGWGRAADKDASVRAIRRKGSWESYESGWSWRAAQGGDGVPGRGAAQSPVLHIGPVDGDSFGAGPGSTQERLVQPGELPMMREKKYDLGVLA